VSDIGIVLRVPLGTHAKFKVGCAKNDRSMQKVLLALIEGWIENGSPDPAHYGKRNENSGESPAGIDREAREGMFKLAKELNKIKERLAELEEDKIRKQASAAGLKQLIEIMKEGDESISAQSEE
jgi:hypothetical protein